MSGSESGHWQTWGAPLTSTILKMAGLGLTANRGAGGPPLVYLGDLISNMRDQGIEQQAGRRFESIMAPREGSVELPGTGRSGFADPMGEAMIPGTPATRRTYQRQPTMSEAFDQLSKMQGVADPVRAHLLDLIRKSRFPTEDVVPHEIARERDLAQRDTERRALGGAQAELYGAQGVPPAQAGAARGVIESGGHPTVQVPGRLEAEEKAFSEEVQAGKHGDPKTAAGLAGIVTAARARGLNNLADHYIRQRGFVKDVAEEGRVTEVRDKLVPKWRTQLEALQQRGVSETSLAGLNAAIAAAESDPSPRNVAGVNQAFANVGKAEEARKQFDARMKAYQKRTDAALKGRNAGAATSLLREITAEIGKYTTIANTHPDPVERAHAAERVGILQEQQGQLRDSLFSRELGGEPSPEGGSPTPAAPKKERYRLTPKGELVPAGQ